MPGSTVQPSDSQVGQLRKGGGSQVKVVWLAAAATVDDRDCDRFASVGDNNRLVTDWGIVRVGVTASKAVEELPSYCGNHIRVGISASASTESGIIISQVSGVCIASASSIPIPTAGIGVTIGVVRAVVRSRLRLLLVSRWSGGRGVRSKILRDIVCRDSGGHRARRQGIIPLDTSLLTESPPLGDCPLGGMNGSIQDVGSMATMSSRKSITLMERVHDESRSSEDERCEANDTLGTEHVE